MKDINPVSIFFLFIILSAFGLPIPLMIFAFVAFVIFKSATNNQPSNNNNPRLLVVPHQNLKAILSKIAE